ncbi:MAG: histidine phosphatase family protein [Ilumatobacteraceae bacterium]
MTRLYLVRHGRATGGWDVDPDPGLDELGRAQAAAVAERLAPLGPMPVQSSPLRRCRETSAPLAEAWGRPVSIEPRVAEIPSPEGIAMDRRVDWLRAAMDGTWADLGVRYTTFRDAVAAAVRSPDTDTVIFSHFIAINAIIGVATGDDRIFVRSLDNCSVTIVDVDADGIHLVEGGHEADTLIR